jgi:hypothetical protein
MGAAIYFFNHPQLLKFITSEYGFQWNKHYKPLVNMKQLYSATASLLLLLLFPVFANATVTVSVTGTNATCSNNGTATALASGGWAPYTYVWSTGATTATITGLAPGDYYVTATDVDLGYAIGHITIFNNALGVSASGTSQICGLVPDGTATAVPYGGTPPYTYHWSNGGTTAQITGLTGGVYTVTVTDISNCTAVASATVVFFNEGVWIAHDSTDVTCFGYNNGTATVMGMSGTPPYTYFWSTGAMTPTVNNLSPGNYTVTVTDIKGCSNYHTFIIHQPTQLVVSSSTTPGTCGLAGTATVTPSGGTPPYTVKWSNGLTSFTINLMPGTYGVTVTDANLCSTPASVTVSGTPNSLLVNASVLTNAGCTIGGTATATASGGSGNYSFSWTPGGQTTATATNLTVGTYTVKVVDITTGCTGTASINVIAAPTLLLATTVVSNATCAVGGSATVNVSGGTPAYTYLWNNGQTTQTATNLSAGPHNVTVTDSKGCVAIATVTIGQSQGPNVTTQVITNATCTSSGSAKATATGGTIPYTYFWSTGSTLQTVTGLAGNATYTVTVTDAGGCTASATVTITLTGGPSVVIASSTVAGCNVGGSATAGATGGTPPYIYHWSNLATGATITNVPAGLYTVTATDGGGCTSTAQVSIAASLPPNVVISASSNAKCDQPGGATANASSGSGPYTYHWSDGETTATASHFTAAGTYTVTVTDALGCTSTASVTISLTNNGITIGDFVWYDDNQDGVQQSGEVGVSGITVMQIKAGPDGIFGTADDVIVASTTTNASGIYNIPCVTPGTYVLMFSGIPAGYQWTTKDYAGTNDCHDSDVFQNGKTDPFTIVAGQADNFCFDAGIHIKCDNVTNAGTICCDQTICEGQTPAALYGSLAPSGGSGTLLYQWMQLLQVGPAPPEWTAITGATSSSYQPGALYETSYFMRCAKRQGCVFFVESNIIKITVLPSGSPGCGPFINNLTVNPGTNNSVFIHWTTVPEPMQYMYEVEHSTNQTDWDVIASVMGKQDPNALNDYDVMDQTPANGTNYYRIKRTSASGIDAFSEIKSIDMTVIQSESMGVYPNPAKDVLHIHNAMKYDQDVVVTIVSTNGRVLDTIVIPQGTTPHLDLPVNDYPAGIYMVRINFGNGKIKTLKITKF